MDIGALLPRQQDGIRVRALSHRDAVAFAEGTRDEAVARFAHLP